MELILVVISLASLLTNIWVIRRMRLRLPDTVILMPPPPIEEPIVEPALEVKTDSAPVQPQANTSVSYSAWSNRKGIAWDEFGHPNETPIQKEDQGPLERPKYGFV